MIVKEHAESGDFRTKKTLYVSNDENSGTYPAFSLSKLHLKFQQHSLQMTFNYTYMRKEMRLKNHFLKDFVNGNLQLIIRMKPNYVKSAKRDLSPSKQ